MPDDPPAPAGALTVSTHEAEQVALLTQIIAGRGLAAASVVLDPAPFRGVLPLPFSALKSGSPVLGNPLNRHRAVPLTYDQFRYAFANA